MNPDGTKQASPHNIYVDDNLMGDVQSRLPYTLVASIESIFVVLGLPALVLQPCALALDKWKLLQIHAIQTLLGLTWNTRDMTVGITPEYRAETVHLLATTWHEGRESFDVQELEKLVGKLGRIGQAYRQVYHLMQMLYASVAFASRENDAFLHATSKTYRLLVKKAK